MNNMARKIAVNLVRETRIDIYDILVDDIEAALIQYGDAKLEAAARVASRVKGADMCWPLPRMIAKRIRTLKTVPMRKTK